MNCSPGRWILKLPKLTFHYKFSRYNTERKSTTCFSVDAWILRKWFNFFPQIPWPCACTYMYLWIHNHVDIQFIIGWLLYSQSCWQLLWWFPVDYRWNRRAHSYQLGIRLQTLQWRYQDDAGTQSTYLLHDYVGWIFTTSYDCEYHHSLLFF